MDEFDAKERIESGSSSEGAMAGEEFWSSGAGHVAQERKVGEPDASEETVEASGEQKDVGKKLKSAETPGKLPGIVPNPRRKEFNGHGNELGEQKSQVSDSHLGASFETSPEDAMRREAEKK